MAGKKEEPRFTLEELCNSDAFVERKDALRAILAKDAVITVVEAKDALEQFYKGGV